MNTVLILHWHSCSCSFKNSLQNRLWKVASSKTCFVLLFHFTRRCAENAFGIAAARWHILLRTIQLLPKNVDYVVKAACVLHNFLAVLNEESEQILDQEDRFGNVVPGRWRQSSCRGRAPRRRPTQPRRTRFPAPRLHGPPQLPTGAFCPRFPPANWVKTPFFSMETPQRDRMA